ncbi:MAG: sigma-54-dependent Fis family transcriptional regulator [Acidobacteria bacterium]|nr:sigma-54-dependent Fis family transcriptional regulator [Acidobacteriota bacterium]
MSEQAAAAITAAERRPRRMDERRGIGWVVEAVAGAAHPPPRPGQVMCAFEEAVAGVLGDAVTARLHRGRTLGAGRRFARDADGAWVAAVPGVPAVLEIGRVDRPPDDWEQQFLLQAAMLATLVLDTDLYRGQLARPRVPPRPAVVGLIGRSAAMHRLRERIVRVARTEAPVLVSGESGVGKELVARLIHTWSRRSAGPFVAVNCASIVESLFEAEVFGIEDRAATGVRGRRGKFELADGGTLFLDEIGDLPALAQAKLLRVLQDFLVERVGGSDAVKVDVRIVAATNRDVVEMVARGGFRLDLFHRLNGIEVAVPPLRAHADDLGDLLEHLLGRQRRDGPLRISAPALAALREYDWPGNVRELERVVERAAALCDGDEVDLEHLPPVVTSRFRELLEPAVVARDSARAFLMRYARTVFEQCGGNKREACRILDVSYHTLRSYLDAAGLPPRVAAIDAGASAVADFVPESFSVCLAHVEAREG